MADLPGVEVLQTEIEKARDKLKGYNENIKKLTGRDPSGPGIRRLISSDGSERNDEHDNYSPMGRGGGGRGRGRVFGLPRRTVMEDNGPPVKRRVLGGAFSRLGPAPVGNRWRGEREDSPYKEELPNKLSVQSSVVSTSREAKDRKEILAEQGKDKEGLQRNRRMFGLLLGTLSKFKTDSKALQTKEERRKKIDQKLEENAAKEKKKFQQETKLLVEEMHLEQAKISRLQQKMDMVAEHGEREEEMKKLKNFIVTRARPKIFWLPNTMNAATENKLKESTKVVDKMLQEGRDRLENEIKDLMDRESKREERIKMRLREDGLLDEDKDGKDKDTGQRDDKSNQENVKLGSGEKEAEEDDDDESDVEDHSDESDLKKTRRVVLEREEGEVKEEVEEEEGEGWDKMSEVISKPIVSVKSGVEGGEEKEDSSSDSDEDRKLEEKEDSEPRRVVELDERTIEEAEMSNVSKKNSEEKEEGARTEEQPQSKNEIDASGDHNRNSEPKQETSEELENGKDKNADEEENVEDKVEKSMEKKDRKKRRERESSEESVKRRRKDSPEKEMKKKADRDSSEESVKERRKHNSQEKELKKRAERDSSEESVKQRRKHDSQDREKKKRADRDSSEESVKRRRKHDSEDREVKKRDREETSSRDKSRRRRDDEDRRRSRRDSRERGRRDSRERDRSRRDKRESKSHRKDKSRSDRVVEEVDLKKETDAGKDRQKRKDKHKSKLMAEDGDVEMQSD